MVNLFLFLKPKILCSTQHLYKYLLDIYDKKKKLCIFENRYPSNIIQFEPNVQIIHFTQFYLRKMATRLK